jgi:hypothetical protein
VGVIVDIGTFRRKGVLTLFREMLIAASKGKILGVRVELEWKDGTRTECVAGKFSGAQHVENCSSDGSCASRMR